MTQIVETTKYPILIGSMALCQYLNKDHIIRIKPNDVDIICDKQTFQYLCDINKKNHNIKTLTDKNAIMTIIEQKKNYYGNYSTQKIDLTFIEEDSEDEFLWFECNKQLNKKFVTMFGLKLILPPLEILYLLMKSHHHRILNLTNDTTTNIELWFRKMSLYEMTRHALNDAHIIDTILYGPKRYGELLPQHISIDSFEQDAKQDALQDAKQDAKQDAMQDAMQDDNKNDDKLIRIAGWSNHTLRRIFGKRFEEVNKIVGDASTMNMDNKQFFDDHVVRQMPHDDLHKLLGETFREDYEEHKYVFTKFKKDPEEAQLSMELWFEYDQNYRIECIREEIMALFLERKLIPYCIAMLESHDLKLFENDQFIKNIEHTYENIHEDWKEIVAHHITNLNGEGHYWLRQYNLNHLPLISQIDSYDIRTLYALALKITGADKHVKMISGNTLEQFEQNRCQNIINSKFFSFLDKAKRRTYKEFWHRFIQFENQSKHSKENYTKKEKAIKKALPSVITAPIVFSLCAEESGVKVYSDFSWNSGLNYDCIDKYITLISNSETIIHIDHLEEDQLTLYSVDHNLGLHIKEKFDRIISIELIYIIITHFEKGRLKFTGESFNLLGKHQQFGIHFTKKVKMEYYYSRQCSDLDNSLGTSRFLTSNGCCPNYLKPLLERITRYWLNIENDFHVPKVADMTYQQLTFKQKSISEIPSDDEWDNMHPYEKIALEKQKKIIDNDNGSENENNDSDNYIDL